jgi:hypothetical protein
MLTDLGLSPVAGSCEHGNEPPGSIKGEELLEKLSECQLHEVTYHIQSVPVEKQPNNYVLRHINEIRSRTTLESRILR